MKKKMDLIEVSLKKALQIPLSDEEEKYFDTFDDESKMVVYKLIFNKDFENDLSVLYDKILSSHDIDDTTKLNLKEMGKDEILKSLIKM